MTTRTIHLITLCSSGLVLSVLCNYSTPPFTMLSKISKHVTCIALEWEAEVRCGENSKNRLLLLYLNQESLNMVPYFNQRDSVE